MTNGLLAARSGLISWHPTFIGCFLISKLGSPVHITEWNQSISQDILMNTSSVSTGGRHPWPRFKLSWALPPTKNLCLSSNLGRRSQVPKHIPINQITHLLVQS